jgi:hypothetical protein
MRDEPEHEVQVDSMTKAELKAQARSRGLPTTGTKAALLERVEQHDRGTDSGDGHGSDDTYDDETEEDEAAHDDTYDEAEDDEAAHDDTYDDESEGEAEAEGDDAARDETYDDEAAEGEADRDETYDDDAQDDADRDEADDDEAADDGAGGEPEESRSGEDGRLSLADVAHAAARAVTELTGHTADAVSGVQRTDDGYHATVEVLEVPRVPPTTDVLATYEVDVDPDGTVADYHRTHRYYRNQTIRT